MGNNGKRIIFEAIVSLQTILSGDILRRYVPIDESSQLSNGLGIPQFNSRERTPGIIT